MVWIILILPMFISFAVSEKIDPDFVFQYFGKKNINQIVTFACWHEQDRFDFTRGLVSQGAKISYNEIHDNLEMKNILKVNYYKIGVILDLDCQRSSGIFNQFSALKMKFNESFNWLVLSTKLELPIEILQELPLTVESEMTMALAKKSTYQLYDIYNHSYRHGGKLNVTSMGQWDRENGLKNNLTQYKYKNRQDFYGLALNFSTIILDEPKPDLKTYLTSPIKYHQDSWSRLHYNLVLYLRDFYNITINLKVDNTWGSLRNPSDGILGGILKGTVDISAAPFEYKLEVLDYVDYTVETSYARSFFIFRQPRKSLTRNVFLQPFRDNVWLFTIALIIFLWILLLISVKIEHYFQSKGDDYVQSNASSESALIALAAISQQGWSKALNFFSGRILFLTVFLWALMMFQFYLASVVGTLLADPPKFINDLYELANSDYNVAFENVPFLQEYLESTIDPAALYLKKKKMKKSLKRKSYENINDGMQKVAEGKYAFLVDSSMGYKIVEETFTTDHICELSLFDIELMPAKALSIVTSKHSPFRKMVIYALRQMVEHGLTARLAKVWRNRRPYCPGNHVSKVIPVDMQEFSPAIFMVVGGLILATIMLAGEHLYAHIKRIEDVVVEENEDEYPDVEESEATTIEA